MRAVRDAALDGPAGWVVGLLGPCAVVAIRSALHAVAGVQPPLVLFVVPVVAAAALGGVRQGILATAVSVLLVDWFLFEPAGPLGPASLGRVLVEAAVAVEGAVGIWMGRALRSARVEARRATELLDALMTNSPVGIGFADDQSRFVRVNEALARVHGAPAAVHPGRTLAELNPGLAAGAGNALAPLVRRVLESGEPVSGAEVSGPDAGRGGETRHWMASLYRLRDVGGRPAGIGFVTADITDRVRAETELRRTAELMGAIRRILSRLVADADPRILFEPMLGELLAITGSEYGVVAEVVHDAAGAPAIEIRATTHGAPARLTTAAGDAPGAAASPDVEAAFARVLATGKLAIAQREGRANGTSHSILAVPLHRGVRMVGAVAIAGRAGGYDEALLRTVQPLVETCAQVMEAYVSDCRRRRAEADREALLGAERRMRAAAETANRAKDAFLAAVSHELRTPIGPIIAWAQMLAEDVLDAAERERAVDTIERNGRALARLVDDLLDVSRMLEGKLQLAVAEVRLSEAVTAALEPLRVALEHKRLRLAVEVAPEAETLRADPDRLRQIVWNLLSNAIKFTPVGGTIAVAAAREGDHVVLRVRDTGCGIPTLVLGRVFERFWQHDADPETLANGLGLGLAITRQLAEAHGGAVRAESEGPGQGATFVVSLPAVAIPRGTSPSTDAAA